MAVKVLSTVRASSKDRLTLDQRLRLHRRLQPFMAWLDRYAWVFTALGVTATIPLMFMDRRSQSPWPFLGLIIYTLSVLIFVEADKIWRTNITRIAASGDVTGVAPLLDFADITFLSLHNRSTKPMLRSEGMVLPCLPDLLARMPAGDGPTLIASQRSALVRMVCSPIYEKYFRAPGLRAKIDAMTEKQ